MMKKKTFHIDEDLLSEAKAACGAATDSETIRLALESLVRRAAIRRICALRGSEPRVKAIPRRRRIAF